MDITSEMYVTLFNEITKATEKIEQARKILKEAQKNTEEIYISKKDNII
ncbi:MAG: hypothetical protein IJC89_04570 [Clostridia bacterium]|nr:hypothetical protein [Clostridia bacterium]